MYDVVVVNLSFRLADGIHAAGHQAAANGIHLREQHVFGRPCASITLDAAPYRRSSRPFDTNLRQTTHERRLPALPDQIAALRPTGSTAPVTSEEHPSSFRPGEERSSRLSPAILGIEMHCGWVIPAPS